MPPKFQPKQNTDKPKTLEDTTSMAKKYTTNTKAEEVDKTKENSTAKEST